MFLNHVFLGLFWILYGVLHSVLAHQNIKSRLAKKLGRYSQYYRLGYNLLAFVLLILLLYFQLRMRSSFVFDPNTLTKMAGIFFTGLGLIIMILCILKYFGGLSGVKGAYIEEASTTLHITGLHHYVRHPLYLGTFIFIWGLFILFPFYSLLIMDVTITAYTLIGIKLEEEKLIHQFGNQYLEYRQKVPMLLPSFRKNL